MLTNEVGKDRRLLEQISIKQQEDNQEAHNNVHKVKSRVTQEQVYFSTSAASSS